MPLIRLRFRDTPGSSFTTSLITGTEVFAGKTLLLSECLVDKQVELG
jgi:hypothetical protein